jgi:hypothetical protein
MSTPTPTRHADLERRLRAAADAVPSQPVPADAWVELQSRLATRDGRHSRRFLAAAAVVALLLALVGAAALLDDGPHSAGPAQGGSDGFWEPENYLGEPVTAETLTLGGQETRHELVLSDTTGKGPSLCDRYVGVADGSGSGGCTARDPHADDPSVAVDWVSGTTGSGDGTHGVVAGVDDRVMKVQVWMDNGNTVLADLKPAGWEGTKMFALTLPPGAPTPQRLVAYSDASGTVLQAVDLADLFGDEWLPGDDGCGDRPAPVTWTYLGDPDGTKESVSARLGFTSASLRIVTNAGTLDSSQCVGLRPRPLAAVSVAGSVVLVVTGPEVTGVHLRSPEVDVVADAVVPDRSSWRITVLRVRSPGELEDAELEADDGTGHVVQAGRLSDLRSTSPQNVSQE